MLLVLSDGGFLAPPNEKPEQEELWNETWKRIDRFQPELFKELFPEEVGKPKREAMERKSKEVASEGTEGVKADGEEEDKKKAG